MPCSSRPVVAWIRQAPARNRIVVAGAQALFVANHFDFERWAVSLVDGQPKDKPGGDEGIDGIVAFPLDNKNARGRVIVSVKGGAKINPSMVRDLGGTVKSQKAEMGVFVCLAEPTTGMLAEARKSGTYTYPLTGASYPRVQIITIKELLDGKRPAMPSHFLPYIQAKKLVVDNQLSLDM